MRKASRALMTARTGEEDAKGLEAFDSNISCVLRACSVRVRSGTGEAVPGILGRDHYDVNRVSEICRGSRDDVHAPPMRTWGEATHAVRQEFARGPAAFRIQALR